MLQFVFFTLCYRAFFGRTN